MKILRLLMCALLLVGCQALPRSSVDEASTREASDQRFEWPDAGRHFTVDEAASELRVVVFPAGALARLGHAHVVGGQVISGRIVLAEPWQASAFRLIVDAEGFEVDRPEWRRDEEFQRDLSDSVIDGTRENMRSQAVLDVARHPLIEIESLGLRGPRWQPDLDLRIRLRGVTRELTVPITLTVADNRITASGKLSLAQSDFGLEPFSVAGGQLAVADRIEIRFRIEAAPGRH